MRNIKGGNGNMANRYMLPVDPYLKPELPVIYPWENDSFILLCRSLYNKALDTGYDESFEDYLNNLKNGKYEDNHLLLKDMRKQFNNNSINDYSNLKNEINTLKNENSELNIILNESKNEINELCEEKSNLLNENENLKNEINEIKSSRIWKLKNKL